MDNRRFDSLVKSLAEGRSRRSVLKGLLGLGGAAAVGGTVLETDSEAARRPTPTPTPVRCPGKQTPQGGQCLCLVPPAPGPEKCGPDCCNPAGVGPAHSECCDQDCCFGTCYGEELCCKTNTGAGGIPPAQRICNSNQGRECCDFSDGCCLIDGCCAGGCYSGPTGSDLCCPAEQFCPNASGNANRCCAAGQLCCAGGSDDNYCAECCSDADCPGAVCSEGRCCKGQGQGPCGGDSLDCCAGLICVGDPGDNSCQLPEPPCIELGGVCDYSDPNCCDPFSSIQCNQIYPDKDDCPVSVNSDYCCRMATGACGAACDCCLDLVCENSVCCQQNGGFCYNSDECCDGLSCVNDSCRPCGELQQYCSQSEPCCDATAACAEVADCGFTGATCCHGAGGVCSGDCDCCGSALVCQDTVCCLPQEMGCQTDSQCCGDLVCRLVCVPPETSCAGIGAACGPDQSCCPGDACTSVSCQNGTCVSQAVVCDDNNACTVDSCDPDRGCVYTTIVCDDQNPCTLNSCNPDTGCEFLELDCSDFDMTDQCLVGTCVGGACVALPSCASGTFCCGDGSCDASCG